MKFKFKIQILSLKRSRATCGEGQCRERTFLHHRKFYWTVMVQTMPELSFWIVVPDYTHTHTHTRSHHLPTPLFSLPIESESRARLHGLYSSWNSPGQNTEVGSLSLLQGIFPTQVSNPGLLHCRWILSQLWWVGIWTCLPVLALVVATLQWKDGAH